MAQCITALRQRNGSCTFPAIASPGCATTAAEAVRLYNMHSTLLLTASSLLLVLALIKLLSSARAAFLTVHPSYAHYSSRDLLGTSAAKYAAVQVHPAGVVAARKGPAPTAHTPSRVRCSRRFCLSWLCCEHPCLVRLGCDPAVLIESNKLHSTHATYGMTWHERWLAHLPVQLYICVAVGAFFQLLATVDFLGFRGIILPSVAAQFQASVWAMPIIGQVCVIYRWSKLLHKIIRVQLLCGSKTFCAIAVVVAFLLSFVVLAQHVAVPRRYRNLGARHGTLAGGYLIYLGTVILIVTLTVIWLGSRVLYEIHKVESRLHHTAEASHHNMGVLQRAASHKWSMCCCPGLSSLGQRILVALMLASTCFCTVATTFVVQGVREMGCGFVAPFHEHIEADGTLSDMHIDQAQALTAYGALLALVALLIGFRHKTHSSRTGRSTLSRTSQARSRVSRASRESSSSTTEPLPPLRVSQRYAAQTVVHVSSTRSLHDDNGVAAASPTGPALSATASASRVVPAKAAAAAAGSSFHSLRASSGRSLHADAVVAPDPTSHSSAGAGAGIGGWAEQPVLV